VVASSDVSGFWLLHASGRDAISGGYVDRYHHRPHSGLDYQTPDEVRRTWEDHQQLQKQAA